LVSAEDELTTLALSASCPPTSAIRSPLHHIVGPRPKLSAQYAERRVLLVAGIARQLKDLPRLLSRFSRQVVSF
jgi:hypothetical protein